VRLIIFEHLIDMDLEKRRKEGEKEAKKRSTVSVTWQSKACELLESLTVGSFLTWRNKPYNLLKSITLVSHEIRKDFLRVYCQKEPFTFTLDASHTKSDAFWLETPEIIGKLRNCRIRILATPDLANGFDPRDMQGSWQLRDRVFALMRDMAQLKDFRLTVHACGNQLWNPILLWHYTSQSFKESDIKSFNRMSFELEGINMRTPNHHMARNLDGDWEWRCVENHTVELDTVGPQDIRRFCNALCSLCPTCNPGKSDDEGE
jgi:hypothetical protein